jgi:ubiquinone/menaquinone biosynthesis C-methylase UbiE
MLEYNMSFAGRMQQYYFNRVYNPLYDLTTRKLYRYQELQQRCLAKLDLRDGDTVLLVGLGTGNELVAITEQNRSIFLTGIDYSSTALDRARRKARSRGKDITLLMMDARTLNFSNDSFDKVVCIHVMDFVPEKDIVTAEIIRVLKPGGQFVITYPSSADNLGLGGGLISDEIKTSRAAGRSRLRAVAHVAKYIVGGLVYLPLYWRPRQRGYTEKELSDLLTAQKSDYRIEAEPVYHDWIAYGNKPFHS